MTIASRFASCRHTRLRSLVAVAMASLTLGGCMEGTEVNGKIFDLLGVSTAAQNQAKAEPKMAQRTGLVLPPNATRLPAPGTGDEPATVASLNDPDKVKANAAAERERLHKAYCSGDLSWKQQIRDPNSIPTSPYGSCSSFTQLNKPAQ
jgi:hypothetical protein